MSDVVVTVPKSFGLQHWIDEGDAAGSEWSGEEWDFYLGNRKPKIQPGERVYIVYNGKLRGYAPLVQIGETRVWGGEIHYSLVRQGGAVAVTISDVVKGFQGFRYRWWSYSDEYPFPDWQTP